jgi:hypothetical protein
VGGDADLMVELKKQYDNWNEYNSTFVQYDTKNYYVNSVYEDKIRELNNIIFKLRGENEMLRNLSNIKEQVTLVERQEKYRAQDTLRNTMGRVNELNEKLDLQQRRLKEMLDKRDNMSLMDKVRYVFGYE